MQKHNRLHVSGLHVMWLALLFSVTAGVHGLRDVVRQHCKQEICVGQAELAISD
jgi:hypothetical protein